MDYIILEKFCDELNAINVMSKLTDLDVFKLCKLKREKLKYYVDLIIDSNEEFEDKDMLIKYITKLTEAYISIDMMHIYA
jgi:hypothetical protein